MVAGSNGLQEPVGSTLASIKQYGIATVFAAVLLMYVLWTSNQVATEMSESVKAVALTQSQLTVVMERQQTQLVNIQADTSFLRSYCAQSKSLP